VACGLWFLVRTRDLGLGLDHVKVLCSRPNSECLEIGVELDVDLELKVALEVKFALELEVMPLYSTPRPPVP
jgi:hypothetical protein